MDTPIAIIIAGALIASMILFTFRFEVEAPSGGESMPVVVRLDRWSGEVAVCPADVTKRSPLMPRISNASPDHTQ